MGRSRTLALAPHLDRSDTDHDANAPCQSVDGLAVADIDRSLDPAFVSVDLGVDGCQSQAGDPRLVEKTAQGVVYVACVQLQNEHGAPLTLEVILPLFSKKIVLLASHNLQIMI
jgi:hypothetical protein